MFSASCYPFSVFSQRQNRLVKTSLPFTHFKLTSCIFRCADRFPNAPHSVFMIRSFGWDVNLFFSILSCFLFLFLSVLFYFTNFFRHQSFSFLSLKILIRRRMLRLRLPDISAACRLPVISDTFLLLWIARNITAFYTRACLKNLVILFLSEIQQKNGVFL